MKAPIAALAALLLAGCVTPSEPKIVTREVSVPVAVKCSADPGTPPAFPDTPQALADASDIFERVKLLLAGRLLRDGWIAILEASSSGCRQP